MTTSSIASTISVTASEKRRNALLLVYAVSLGLLSVFNSPYISLFSLFALSACVLFDKQLALSLYICSAIVGADFSSIETLVSAIVVLAIGVSVFDLRDKRTKRLLMSVTLFSMSMLAGFALGANSQMITILILTFKLFMMVTIAQSATISNGSILEKAILYGGLVIAGITAYHFYVGDISVLSEGQGRLTYRENVKELSTAIVIPVYMSINKMLDYRNRRNNRELLFFILVFALCFPLLLMTYSRGVFIGLLVSAVLLQLAYSKSLSVQKIVIYTLIVAAVVNIVSSMQLDESLIFENIEGGNGRTDIWANYLAYMSNQGIHTLVWGLGSNSYTSLLEFYDHSVILSYYFHFGIFGILFITYVVLSALTRLYRSKKPYYLFLVVLTVLMFFTHGSYDNTLFYIVSGMCLGAANSPQKTYRK